MKSFLALAFMLLVSGTSFAESLSIHTFYTKDFKNIGNLYITLNENNLLNEAYIKHKGKIIYRINRNGFFNENGLEMECPCTPFYGFIIDIINRTSISIYKANKYGKPDSDVAIIEWSPASEKFTFLLPT